MSEGAAVTARDVTPCPKEYRDSKPRKPLKQRRRTSSDVWKAAKAVALERAQGCEACDLIAAFVPGWECGIFPVDVHHRRRQGPGRSKGGGHMQANLRVVCRKAHTGWIHDIKNQELARSLGLLVLPDDSEFAALGLVKEQAA